MKNKIIDIFESEKELLKKYPKKFYWNLKDIFNDYWDDFLDFADKYNGEIRQIVLDEVFKMRICKTKDMGYSLYECPTCHKQKVSYNTCKSRFCNSCGVKYSKQRTTYIMSKLLKTEHRHLVFTMPDILWNLFLKDRTLLDIPFYAVSQTINSWFKQQYKFEKYQPGFILVLHTFGRDDNWNVHIHCLLSTTALGINKEKKFDFIPFEMLRRRFQKILLDTLYEKIGPEFKELKNNCYKYNKGFYVRAKKNEFPNSRKAIEYILRYCGRPCFASYRIIDIENNYISFWYQRHEDDKFVVERIHIFEFIARLIQHIPEKNFKTIRYYGFYSTKHRKLYDIAQKLIDTIKIPFFQSLNKWRNLSLKSFNIDPLKCSCGSFMKFLFKVPRLI